MNSVILCEGSTDYALLQYYMQKANGWSDGSQGGFKIGKQKSRKLLKAFENNDAYDAEIVRQCRSFVDVSDPQRKYLTKRRYITKAKYDAFFCIRTAAEQFEERKNILKNIPWENYHTIQQGFSLLNGI